MKNKNNYNSPELDIISVLVSDIITASIGDSPFPGEDDELDAEKNGM